MSDELEAIKNLLYRVGAEVVNEAKDIAPYAKGNLKRDIQVFTDDINKLEIDIGNTLLAPYALYVHEGTGLFGPKKKRITPKKAKALKTPYGYRKSIAGQKAQPYLSDGLENYINNGGLNRALDAAADDVGEEVFKDIKKSLKNVNIK